MNPGLVSNKLKWLGLTVLLLSITASAWAQTYTAIDLGTLPGGSISGAYGINNRGQVVGYSDTPGGQDPRVSL